jgi:hypothetical protein
LRHQDGTSNQEHRQEDIFHGWCIGI